MTTDAPVLICRRSTGFTLIELLVTLALAAILGSLAAPAVRDFIVRSKLNNLGAEFTGSLLKVRNEAVNRNTCVTMCMSSSAGDAAPACTTTGTDWQVGWIAFLNPTCDSGANAPADSINMILARPSMGADFSLKTQNNQKKFLFNARGAPDSFTPGQFNITYQDGLNSLSSKYGVNVCIDGLGRSRTVPSSQSCATYN